MAKSKSTKKLFNMAYGLGASIVIMGALFKILHWELGPINGGLLLAIGLITEAIIFAISAFEPIEDEYDWSLVYPELSGAESQGKRRNAAAEEKAAEASLSKKLDNLLREAGVDANLMKSLGSSIKNFEDATKGITSTADAMQSTQKYSEEMVNAAAQMESLNSLYKVQLENASKQASVNQEVVQNASVLKDQMASLSTSLSSLNGVYGGMLSAMNKN